MSYDKPLVRCDMPVEVVWDDVCHEFSVPKVRPVAGAKTAQGHT
jgi:hypothetical protein